MQKKKKKDKFCLFKNKKMSGRVFFFHRQSLETANFSLWIIWYKHQSCLLEVHIYASSKKKADFFLELLPIEIKCCKMPLKEAIGGKSRLRLINLPTIKALSEIKSGDYEVS